MSKSIPISGNSLDNIFKDIIDDIYPEGVPAEFYRLTKWGFMLGAGFTADALRTAADVTSLDDAEQLISTTALVARMLDQFSTDSHNYAERIHREATERN